MTRAALMALMLACMLAACTKSENGGVSPRRYAYPRTEMPDTTATLHHVGNTYITLSRGAATELPRHGWLTAHYPTLGASLYLTSTDDASAEALANRRQRISLNLGGRTAHTEEFVNTDGYVCQMVLCPEDCATPVQFVAIKDGSLVSGSFNIAGKTTPADSIHPIVDALAREAGRLLSRLAND